MSLVPFGVLPGRLAYSPKHHRNCADWYYNLLAYGAENYIVVYDIYSSNRLQTLDFHIAPVVRIKWCHDYLALQTSATYKVRLASGDASGLILVWDVPQCRLISSMQGKQYGPLVDLAWIPKGDGYLMSLHQNTHLAGESHTSPVFSIMALWNIETAQCLWSIKFSELILCFVPSAHPSATASDATSHASQLHVLNNAGSLYDVSGFTPQSAPTVELKAKLILRQSAPMTRPEASTPSTSPYSSLNNINISVGGSGLHSQSRSKPILKVSRSPVQSNSRHSYGGSGSGSYPSSARDSYESFSGSEMEKLIAENEDMKWVNFECVIIDALLSYHDSNIIFFYSKRMIYVFDLIISQIVATIEMDRSLGNIQHVIQTKVYSNRLFILHEDGILSSWIKRETYNFVPQTFIEFNANSSVQVQSRTNKMESVVVSIVCSIDLESCFSPSLVLLFTIVKSDGTVAVAKYIDYPEKEELKFIPKKSILSQSQTISSPIPLQFVKRNGPEDESSTKEEEDVWLVPNSKFVISRLDSTLTSSACCLSRNVESDLLAVGTNGGSIQIFDLAKFKLLNEVLVQNSPTPVRGVKWVSRDRLIFFVTDPVDKVNYKNKVALLTLGNGQLEYLLKGTELQSTYIRGIRISPSRKYVIILFRDMPLQIWDLTTFSILKFVNAIALISSIEWADSSFSEKESFIFVCPDGKVHRYKIEDNAIVQVSQLYDISLKSVTTIAWKENLIVFGDATGVVVYLDTSTNTLHSFQTNSYVRKVQFEPTRMVTSGSQKFQQSYRGFIHLADDAKHQAGGNSNAASSGAVSLNPDVIVWDFQKHQQIANSHPSLRSRGISCELVDWACEGQIIVYCSDGALRILDRSLLACNAPVGTHTAVAAFFPFNVNPMLALKAKSMLHFLNFDFASFVQTISGVGLDARPTLPKTFVDAQFLSESVSPAIIEIINVSAKASDSLDALQENFLRKEILISNYFGNKLDIEFWELLRYLLSRTPKIPVVESSSSQPESNTPRSQAQPTASQSTAATTSQPKSSSASESSSSLKALPAVASSFFSPTVGQPPIYQTAKDTKQSVAEKSALYNQHTQYKDTDAATEKRIADFQLLMGNKEKVVEKLLETDVNSNQFMLSALKACVISASISTEAFQNSIKLLATNLIANGQLLQGVELLSLIGKGLDSCRYLQTYDKWEYAAWLAKATLTESEVAIVMRRWANHLIENPSEEDKNKALNIFLMINDYHEVLQILCDHENMIEKAVPFYILVQKSLKENTVTKKYGASRPLLPLPKLLQSIFVKYSLQLQNIGFHDGAHFFESVSKLIQTETTTS